MEKYQHMKGFITSAQEYSRNHNEKSVNALQRHLQILSVTSDLSIFDPGTSIAAEFYVSLHELMSGLESRSSLLWCAISVLQQACHNPVARAELIHTYKYTPILSKLLGANLMRDKRLKVLQLMQELTYGVKISWLEAHLQKLISALTQWILNDEKDVVVLSLSVLVNLCYKNLPAVYTLMRCVDKKQFFRTILKLQNDINTRVQVCKLLIILEHFSGEIPESDILHFVCMTFSSFRDAFKANDVFLLRHIVDFFKDVQNNAHTKEILLTYDRFLEDSQMLLSQVSEKANAECVAMLFEFFHSLIAMQITTLASLYMQIVSQAMLWISTEMACTQALSLIHTIAVVVRKEQHGKLVKEHIIELFEKGLSVLLLILDTGGDATSITSETRIRFTALLKLLQEMCKVSNLREKILSSINHNIMIQLFQSLLSIDPSEGNNLFQNEVTSLYVQALDFMSDLAPHDSVWLNTYSTILQNKQIQMVLAVALYTGNEDVKRQVLTLTGTVGFPGESVGLLAKSLCDLEPLVMLPSRGKIHPQGCQSVSNCQSDFTTFFTLAQEGRLDDFINRLEEAAQSNQIIDLSTSAVMELYEYKLAALGHSERALHTSLEAANNHATHLQHRVAQMSAEASRLHQLLYHNQQCLEGLQNEKKYISERLEAAKATADEIHTKHIEELKSKQKAILELTNEVANKNKMLLNNAEAIEAAQQKIDNLQFKAEGLMKQLTDKEGEIKALQKKLNDQMSKNSELSRLVSKMEDKITKKDKLIDEKDNEIEKFLKNVQSLKEEICSLNMLCKAHEKTIVEKESEINIIHSQVIELQRMREVIFEISGGKKKMDK